MRGLANIQSSTFEILARFLPQPEVGGHVSVEPRRVQVAYHIPIGDVINGGCQAGEDANGAGSGTASACTSTPQRINRSNARNILLRLSALRWIPVRIWNRGIANFSRE